MKIGEFSNLTGLPILTLRHYMDIGLLSPQKEDRYWKFTEEDLERAREIAQYKDCGLSLSAIGEMLSLHDQLQQHPEDAGLSQQCGSLFAREFNRLHSRQAELLAALNRLEEMTRSIRGQVVTESFNGIPFPLFSLICCPKCGSPLNWENVHIACNQVCRGQGSCACGFHAEVSDDGILITADAQRPLIPAVDRQMATLQQRTPQDVSYIESFNQWLIQHLASLDLKGKVIFEDVLNTACFLNRTIGLLDREACYILCDTDLEVVRYYMSSIRAAYPHRNILFLVDDGIHHPLCPGCLDIVIDYAASEIYQKYGYRSSSTPLRPYAHNDTIIAGRFSRLCKKQLGERDPAEYNPLRYRQSVLLEDMERNGIQILKEKTGSRAVDPSVYIGTLPGDILKPYAFIGRWKMP